MCSRPAFPRVALLWPLLVVVSLCLVAACSGSDPAAGGATGENAPVAIEVTDSSVTIVNRTGTSLVKGQVDLVTTSLPYFVQLERVQSGEKRTIRLDSFRSKDGTPFRRGVTRVRSVKITATDLFGKTHEYQVPFK